MSFLLDISQHQERHLRTPVDVESKSNKLPTFAVVSPHAAGYFLRKYIVPPSSSPEVALG